MRASYEALAQQKIDEIKAKFEEKRDQDRQRIKERDAQWAAEDVDALIEQINKENEVKQELQIANGNTFDNQRLEIENWYKEKIRVVGDNEMLIAALTEEYEKRKTAVSQAEGTLRLQIVSNLLDRKSVV